MRDYAERLAVLETTVRRQRRVVAVLGACIAFFALGAVFAPEAVTSEELRAKRLVIVDGHGNDRIVAEVLDAVNPSPGISLLDAQGRSRIRLTCVEGWGPGLYLFDDHGEKRVGLTHNDKVSYFTFSDRDGEDVYRVSQGPDRGVTMQLRQGEGLGGNSFFVTSNLDGGPALSLTREGVHGFLFSVSDDGPLLTLSDDRGRPRAVLGAMEFIDAEDRKTIHPPSSLFLIDADGRTLWRGPVP